MPEKGLEVVVRFSPGIPTAVQGPALLHLEMELRAQTKLDVRVVKDLMGDDSKLRSRMTLQQRDSL